MNVSLAVHEAYLVCRRYESRGEGEVETVYVPIVESGGAPRLYLSKEAARKWATRMNHLNGQDYVPVKVDWSTTMRVVAP